ncbi:ferredoxin [Thermodesulfobacteriota bacterium]
MQEQSAPYQCHIFVCTNDRKGERKSCADGSSAAVRSQLKDAVKERGWLGRVRVSQSGCLGLCMQGPNIILYPQKIWFSGVSTDDIPAILNRVAALLEA